MKILRIIACFLWKLICNYSILRNCKHYASMRSEMCGLIPYVKTCVHYESKKAQLPTECLYFIIRTTAAIYCLSRIV